MYITYLVLGFDKKVWARVYSCSLIAFLRSQWTLRGVYFYVLLWLTAKKWSKHYLGSKISLIGTFNLPWPHKYLICVLKKIMIWDIKHNQWLANIFGWYICKSDSERVSTLPATHTLHTLKCIEVSTGTGTVPWWDDPRHKALPHSRNTTAVYGIFATKIK